MVRWSAIAALVLALSACTESDVKTTEVRLFITSDLKVPTELDAITVWARGPDGTARDATAHLKEPGDLPADLHLLRGQAPYAPLEVSITGMRAGRPVLTRQATLQFLPNESRILPMALLRECMHVDCGDDTCTELGCASLAVDPRTLPLDESALAPFLVDGGLDAEGDAGNWPAKNGGPDAGPAVDAGLQSDGGAPPRSGDAGLDAGTSINIEPGARDAGDPDGGASQCILSPACAGLCESLPLLGGKTHACLCVLQCGFIGIK
jgi:hypothetical protein